MKDTSPRESALFTGHERILIVMGGMFIFLIMASLVIGLGDFEAPKSTIVSEIFSFIRRWARFADELGTICFLLSIVVTAVVVFRTARRAPDKVATAMAWSAGVTLLMVYVLVSLLLNNEDRHSFYLPHYFPHTLHYYVMEGLHISALFSVGLFGVLIAGEFYCLTQERVMREELRVAEEEGEEVVRCVFLRQQLVLAVLGPRMPVLLAVRYTLALLFIVLFSACIVLKLVESIGSLESDLPAPVIDKAGVREQRSQIELRLTEDRKILHKRSDGLLEVVEVDAMLKSASLEIQGERHILLRVEANATYEQLIEIVSAAYTAGVPVVLAD